MATHTRNRTPASTVPATPVQEVGAALPVGTALDSTALPLTTPLDTRTRLTQEYVAGGGFGFGSGGGMQTLPTYIDDVTAKFGLDLYRRMRTDTQAETGLQLRIGSIAQNGVKAMPPVPKDHPDFDEAQRIADFVQYNLDNLERPFTEILQEMLLCMAYGFKVAELTYELRDPVDPTITHAQLFLQKVKPKPIGATGFVVDRFRNLLGILYLRPNQIMPAMALIRSVLAGAEAAPSDGTDAGPIILDPEKCWVFSWAPENEDPRGMSIFRGAFHAWNTKGQLWKGYMQFLAHFAEPSLAGFTDPESEPDEPEDGSAAQSPEEQMLSQLIKMQNGACGAFPGGARVDVVQAKGEGQAFLMGIKACDMDIIKATTGQQLMTEVSDHMTRAASGVHQDAFGVFVRLGKTLTAGNIEKQLFYRLVAYNYGAETAARLTPKANLGQAEHQDFAAYAAAISSLLREGFFAPDQYVGLDDLLAVPLRDPRAWAAQLAKEEAMVDPTQLASDEQKLDSRNVAKIQATRVASHLGQRGP